MRLLIALFNLIINTLADQVLMKENSFELHIVSFTIPYPADYGGAIDVFYRLRTLHQLGVKIHLHCFQYDRPQAPELQKYCENVFYYKRKKGILSFLSTSPFIIESRRSKKLLKRLKTIQAPILFEGEHTTAYIDHPDLQTRSKFVRLHNIEHTYYARLAASSNSFLHKLYFRSESAKLRRYEKKLYLATAIFPISSTELEYFQEINEACYWLPAFHHEFNLESRDRVDGTFLYHGDLSIVFNQNVIEKLAQIFKNRKVKLSVAGKMKDGYFNYLMQKYPWISIYKNPTHKEMLEIMNENAVHLIFSEHEQGVKLKLVHSLLTNAQVIANPKAVMGSKLESCVHLIEIDELGELLSHPKLKIGIDQKHTESLLNRYYSNTKNAEDLVDMLLVNR